jgi:cbb3-type cytochrome oxidase maturation protein
MESLYLLIPLSAGLVLVILAIFGWALHGGQFEDLEREGERILNADEEISDAGQDHASVKGINSKNCFDVSNVSTK